MLVFDSEYVFGCLVIQSLILQFYMFLHDLFSLSLLLTKDGQVVSYTKFLFDELWTANY